MNNMSFMPTEHYKAGQVIFEEGYAADGVYFICSGNVKIIKKRGDREIVLANLGEGSIFGEMAFIDARPRSATVIATEDTWCYKHNKDVFNSKIKALDPLLAKTFQDLVEVIREKSKAKMFIDHGTTHPIFDADDTRSIIDETLITPSKPKITLLTDKKIQSKLNELDLFMRTLFLSLVDIAYR